MFGVGHAFRFQIGGTLYSMSNRKVQLLTSLTDRSHQASIAGLAVTESDIDTANKSDLGADTASVGSDASSIQHAALQRFLVNSTWISIKNHD